MERIDSSILEQPKLRILTGQEEIEARKRLALERERQRQAEQAEKPPEVPHIDLDQARKLVESAHEQQEADPLVKEVVESVRGTVVGNVNTTEAVIRQAAEQARAKGRNFTFYTGGSSGWSSFGEVAQRPFKFTSMEFLDTQRAALAESSRSGAPIEEMQEVRLGQAQPDGKVEVGLTLYTPTKLDEFGRGPNNTNVIIQLPQDLAARVAAKQNPEFTHALVEGILIDYGFPPEVMQTSFKP